MKKAFILISVMLALAAMTQAQNLAGFFDKYAEDERFAYSKIGKEMQTLSLEINAGNKALAESLEKEILEILKKENFDLEIASRDKGERSYIYTRPKGNQKETVIINRDKGEINVLWTVGKDKKAMHEMGFMQDLSFLGELSGLSNLETLSSLGSLSDLKELEKLKDLKIEIPTPEIPQTEIPEVK